MTDMELERWGDVVEDLRGTPGLYGIPEDLQDNKAFLEYLDQEIFICETCGWWCERCEETQDPDHFGSCVQCHSDDPEDDEC